MLGSLVLITSCNKNASTLKPIPTDTVITVRGQKINDSINEIEWISTSKLESKYQIERSEGVSFNIISSINSNGTSGVFYNYIDNFIISNIEYYRLKIYYQNGSYRYSNTTQVRK